MHSAGMCDTAGQLLPVPVRVGQAVDVVAQAGRPKSITGKATCESTQMSTDGTIRTCDSAAAHSRFAAGLRIRRSADLAN